MIERFGHIATRLFNTPLAIHPRKAEVLVAALAEQLRISPTPMAFEDDGFDFTGPGSSRSNNDRGYDMVGPVAVVPVCGTLVQKTGSLRPWSGLVGYDGLRQAFLTAIIDPEVEAVVLDIDSPGGEVAGMFDLADAIYEARGSKPISAILTEKAFSAAYLMASACDPGRVYVPRTGGTGSAGIIMGHIDASKALEKDGLKVTFVTYGSKKLDGRPELPLSETALTDMEAEALVLGDMLVETIARNRGMTTAAVKATQAGSYLGAAGVEVGFADAVKAPDAAYRALLAQLG